MPRSDAIDISHHNTVADWDAVPEFRLGIHKVNEGTAVDRRFAERMPIMRDRFEMWGGYTVLIVSRSTIREQVENYARLIEPWWDTGAVTQLDVEPWDQYPRPVTADEIDEAQDHHIRLLDRPALVYINPRQMPAQFEKWRERNPIGNTTGSLWEPYYNTRNGVAAVARSGAIVWQWTSRGTVPGFTAGIDVNEVQDWRLVEMHAGLVDGLHPIRPPINPDPPPEANMPKYLKRYPKIGVFNPDNGLLIADDDLAVGAPLAGLPIVDSDPDTDTQFRSFLHVNGAEAAFRLGIRYANR